MAWNPSVNDMTPQILMQGAQMWQNAGANMQNGINHVFDEYKRKQEENKDIAAKGKSAAQFLQNFGKELGFGEEQLNQFLTKSADETDRQYALRVSSGLKEAMTLPEMRKAQAEIRASNAQVAQANAQTARLTQELEQKKRDLSAFASASAPYFPQTATADAIKRGASFESLPTGARPFNPAQFAGDYAAKGGSMEGLNQFDTYAKLMTPAAPKPPEFGWQYSQDGKLVAIPGGPHDPNSPQKIADLEKARLEAAKIKAENDAKAAQAADAEKKQKENADLQAFTINQALNTLKEAKEMVKPGMRRAGGTFEGQPIVRDALAVLGMPGSQVLNKKYQTINSVLSLQNMMALKNLSATGASGLGSTQVKELEMLASDAASLDTSLPEDEQLNALNKIEARLNKILGVQERKAGTAQEPKPLSTAQRAKNAVGRTALDILKANGVIP